MEENPNRTWSSVVSNVGHPKYPPNTRNNAPILPARPAVLIFPKDVTGLNNTLETLKTSINPSTLGITITGVREIKNGGVVVHPSTDAEATKLANAPTLSDAGLKAAVATHKLPRIAIYGLPQTLPLDNIVSAIHQQTHEETGLQLIELKEKILFSHKVGPRTGSCTHVFRVPPSVRHSLIGFSKLAMDWQVHSVRDWIDNLKCGHCQLYGHTASKCNADTPTCSHCGKHGHNRVACPTPDEPPSCATCKFFKKPATHNTGSPDCPARQAAERRELSRVNFLD